MVPYIVRWTINGENFTEGFLTWKEALGFARMKIMEDIEFLEVQ